MPEGTRPLTYAEVIKFELRRVHALLDAINEKLDRLRGDVGDDRR